MLLVKAHITCCQPTEDSHEFAAGPLEAQIVPADA